MKRSLKFSLSSGNTDKIKKIDVLYLEYNKITNDFIQRLCNKESLSEDYLKSLHTKLSYRYKQCAKRQAMNIYRCWHSNKRRGINPILKNSMTLDYRFLEVQKGNNSFDYWIKLATLEKGNPILIPIKSYSYANKYFLEWNLVKGGKLLKTTNGWIVALTFEKQTPKRKDNGNILGIDIGIKKLIVDSNRNVYGKNIESIMDKIQRKEQGSKAFKRALHERDCYVNKTVKELLNTDCKVIVLEGIKNIKKNTKKEGRLSKQFRSKFQRWTYSKLISRIKEQAEVDGVHCLFVPPAYTSQTCSKCRFVHKLNRNGEIFKCRNCGYTLDADYNASLNILNLGLAQQSMVAESA